MIYASIFSWLADHRYGLVLPKKAEKAAASAAPVARSAAVRSVFHDGDSDDDDEVRFNHCQ